MTSLCEQCRAIIEELETGTASREDVIAWADSLIEASDEPDPDVCEIAVMTNARTFQIVDVLRRVPGIPRPEIVLSLLLESFVRKLDSGAATYPKVARWIFLHALDHDELWGDSRNEAMHYDDQFDLLQSGVVEGDENALREDMKALLKRVASMQQDAA